MIEEYDVILRPILTEKGTKIKEKTRTVCFKVHLNSTKIQVKKAVEHLFSTKVDAVRVAIISGKMKRRGRITRRTPDWKKAFVTIKAGEKMIEFFEG